MVVSERDGTLRRWNLGRLQRSGALGRRLPVPASALAFSPDGSRLATVAAGPGRDPRTVHVLDAGSGLPDGPPLRGLAPGGSQTVAWSHDGRLVAAGDYAGDVHTWNARTGAPGPLSVSRLGDPVLSVAFSPDGRRLAATFGTGGAGVYDVASGRLVATLGSGDEVRWVAWSPDGRLLVTGHYDGRARLWTTATWRPAGTLAGHEGYVLWAGFSPDGRTLATSGTDGTALLWDVASRRQIGSRPDRRRQPVDRGELHARRTPAGGAGGHGPRRCLADDPRGLGAARLRGRRPVAHAPRVGGTPSRPALPPGLRLTSGPS